MVCGVRRIHRRAGIDMVPCSQLSAVLNGLTVAFIKEHGAEALLPLRREPLGPHLLSQLLGGHPATRSGQPLGTDTIDWSSPRFLTLGTLFAVAGSTGFRKAEVALPANTTFDDRRLSRSSLLWLIDGTFHADPSPTLLHSLTPGRDFAVLKPPRSKADQDGTKFGALPIYLPFDPSDPINAASSKTPNRSNLSPTPPSIVISRASCAPSSPQPRPPSKASTAAASASPAPS